MGGLYDSWQKNQGQIDAVEGSLQNFYAKKQQDQARARLLAMMTAKTVPDANPSTQTAPTTDVSALPSTNAAGVSSAPQDSQALADNLNKASQRLQPVAGGIPSIVPTKTQQPNFNFSDVLSAMGSEASPETVGSVALKQAELNRPEDTIEKSQNDALYAVRKANGLVTGVNMLEPPTFRPVPGRQQWVSRDGATLYDYPRAGDEPYSKNENAGKQWIYRKGQLTFDNPDPDQGDLPFNGEHAQAKDLQARRQKLQDEYDKLRTENEPYQDALRQGKYIGKNQVPIDLESNEDVKALLQNKVDSYLNRTGDINNEMNAIDDEMKMNPASNPSKTRVATRAAAPAQTPVPTPAPAPGGGTIPPGKIHVKNLLTGETGTIPAAKFDKAKYVKIP